MFSRGSQTVAITNNQIRQYNAVGINVQTGSPGSTAPLNATVTGNVVEQPGAFGSNAFELNSGTNSGNANIVCLKLTGNTFENGGSTANFEDDVILRHRLNTTVRVPAYTPAADGSGKPAYLGPLNPGSETYITSTSGAGGGFTNTPTGADCPLP